MLLQYQRFQLGGRIEEIEIDTNPITGRQYILLRDVQDVFPTAARFEKDGRPVRFLKNGTGGYIGCGLGIDGANESWNFESDMAWKFLFNGGILLAGGLLGVVYIKCSVALDACVVGSSDRLWAATLVELPTLTFHHALLPLSIFFALHGIRISMAYRQAIESVAPTYVPFIQGLLSVLAMALGGGSTTSMFNVLFFPSNSLKCVFEDVSDCWLRVLIEY
ncbi:hypothetical protein BGZ46_009019 [Entomortierella lignicola]|nr:hypothetical protein BGZ46_009019 [Entomortierella lignicola]